MNAAFWAQTFLLTIAGLAAVIYDLWMTQAMILARLRRLEGELKACQEWIEADQDPLGLAEFYAKLSIEEAADND